MTLPKTTFTCAGDMLAARLIPTTYQGFAEVADFIKKATSGSAIWRPYCRKRAKTTATSSTADHSTVPTPEC